MINNYINPKMKIAVLEGAFQWGARGDFERDI